MNTIPGLHDMTLICYFLGGLGYLCSTILTVLILLCAGEISTDAGVEDARWGLFQRTMEERSRKFITIFLVKKQRNHLFGHGRGIRNWWNCRLMLMFSWFSRAKLLDHENTGRSSCGKWAAGHAFHTSSGGMAVSLLYRLQRATFCSAELCLASSRWLHVWRRCCHSLSLLEFIMFLGVLLSKGWIASFAHLFDIFHTNSV